MQAVQIFNALEAAFWLALAGCAAALGHRTAGFTRGRQIALTISLVGFGLSDVWEVFSGGWWKPLPLLALKAICLLGLVITATLIYRSRWRQRRLNHRLA